MRFFFFNQHLFAPCMCVCVCVWRARGVGSYLLWAPWHPQSKVNAQDYLTDDLALYRTLKKVNRNGVCLLTDVGTEEGTVLDLARRVSPLSHTMLYGDSFDVISSVRDTDRDNQGGRWRERINTCVASCMNSNKKSERKFESKMKGFGPVGTGESGLSACSLKISV